MQKVGLTPQSRPCVISRNRPRFYGVPVWEFNLPAGHTCPFAKDCRTASDRATGIQTPGPGRVFKCYAATAERYPAVRRARWQNFDELRGASRADMAATLNRGLSRLNHRAYPFQVMLRIHGGGDFFSQDYFDAWLAVCSIWRKAQFWAFTKSVRYWVERLDRIPSNLTLQASYGGRDDELIERHGLKFAKWFPSEQAAKESGLPIDVDDTLAMRGTQSFALVDNYARTGTDRKSVDSKPRQE